MLISILFFVNFAILIYFLVISVGYIALLLLSLSDTFRRFKEVEGGSIVGLMKSYSLPPVTVIMPAYNEEETISDAVTSILNNNYVNTYLVIINDGSTDNTLRYLIDKYDLLKIDSDIEKKIPMSNAVKGYYISQIYKNITVIDKYHTDRSDTMNIGVNASQTPLIMTVDADTLIEPTAITNLVFYMLSKPHMDAVGGGVYVINGCKVEDGKVTYSRIANSPLLAIQACEYMRSFLFSKSGWNPLSGALCYSGTATLFKAHSLREVGGFEIDNLAQDFEVITHIRADQYERHLSSQVGYTPAAIVWTDVPATIKEYWHQRFNWQYYSLASLMRHSKMLFNPAYGVVGLFTYPFFLFVEVLGAVVEFTAYLCIILSVILGVFDWYTAVLWFAFAWGFFTLLTMVTALININTFNRYHRLRDMLLILFYTLFEAVGFRQFNITCRVVATFSYFFGGRKQKTEYALNDR